LSETIEVLEGEQMEKIHNSGKKVSSPLFDKKNSLLEINPSIRQVRETQGEEDAIVYEIIDYTTSLVHASEMMAQGYHVTTLIFKKELPTPNNHDILLMEGC